MDYTQIIVSVIGLIVAVLTGVLVPYLKQKYGETKIAQTQQYVDIAVRAAEQLFKTEQAQEKKAYVINYLSERGIKFDTATIENMIESSVLLLHNELYGTKQEESK